MREYKAIFICILICNVFVCPKSFGQTDYTYEKGKVFQEHKRFVNDRYD